VVVWRSSNIVGCINQGSYKSLKSLENILEIFKALKSLENDHFMEKYGTNP